MTKIDELKNALIEKSMENFELVNWLDENDYEYWFTETSIFVWGNGIYLRYHYDSIDWNNPNGRAFEFFENLLQLMCHLLWVDERAESIFKTEDHNKSQIKQDLLDLARRVKDYSYEKNGERFCKEDNEACIPGESSCLLCRTKLEWIAENIDHVNLTSLATTLLEEEVV